MIEIPEKIYKQLVAEGESAFRLYLLSHPEDGNFEFCQPSCWVTLQPLFDGIPEKSLKKQALLVKDMPLEEREIKIKVQSLVGTLQKMASFFSLTEKVDKKYSIEVSAMPTERWQKYYKSYQVVKENCEPGELYQIEIVLERTEEKLNVKMT